MIVHMIGNAHLDPVWLWGWQAGVDEAMSTLQSAVDRCDEYPDFIYSHGEAWLYRQAERLRPALFARIRALATAGRWRFSGGTWVQPDLNLPTEVALRRQIRHGQAYFRDRFGVVPHIAHNVDCFGHPAFLPDLLAEHGYSAAVLGRPSQARFPIPSSAFLWRGAGGAAIPAFRITSGYGWAAPDITEHIQAAVTAADPRLGHTMCFYGVSDHGGGPTRRQLDWIIANRHALPGIELRLSTEAAFFAAIADHHAMLPVVEGELQHCCIGCYSVMGDIKRAQRHGELALDQAERAMVLAEEPADRAEYARRIDAAWPDLLFTGFHDILAGTATPSAWDSVRAMQGRARIAAEEVLLDITRRWAGRALPHDGTHRIVIINTDDAPFDGLAEHETWLDYEIWSDHGLFDATGARVPVQRVQPEAMHRVPRLLFPLRIPAAGASVLTIRPITPPATDATEHVAASHDPDPHDLAGRNAQADASAALPPCDLTATPDRLANSRLTVDLRPGAIAAIACDGIPLLGPGGLMLQLRHDHSDTWGSVPEAWTEPVIAALDQGAWVVEESGPLRARLRLEQRLGTSRLRWTLSLAAGTPTLTMRLEINFDERCALLQLVADLARVPEARTDAVPGGAIARPLGLPEYPVQGWSRLRHPDLEVAILTQDAFSLSADATRWQWTLLRAPLMAWEGRDPPIYHGRQVHTDQGVHDLTLCLTAGASLPDADLHRAARRLGQPLISFERTEGAPRPLA